VCGNEKRLQEEKSQALLQDLGSHGGILLDFPFSFHSTLHLAYGSSTQLSASYRVC
jgi:hypothetical protein